MFARVRNRVKWPRLWLSAAVICLGISAVLGYHQDQMAASSVLAQKAGEPITVRIQDFDPEIHGNINDQLSVLAEVALDRQVRMQFGSGDTARLVDVVPLYVVGRDTEDAARRQLGIALERSRPRLRAEAGAIREESLSLAELEAQPVAAIVAEVDEGEELTASGPDFVELGEGANGPLVSIRGVRLHDQALEALAANQLSEQGLVLPRETFLVSVDPTGIASAAIVPDFSTMRHGLVSLSFIFIGLSLISAVSFLPLLNRRDDVFQEPVEMVSRFPGAFQPIRTQEEIRRDERGVPPMSRRRIVSRNLSAG